MFDKLRQQNDSDSDADADEPPAWTPDDSPSAEEAPASPRRALNFGGGASGLRIPFISQFNPMQRFVLALMIFLLASEFGCFLLLAFGYINF